MRISEKGKELIKSYEGCRLQAYKCPAGAWTIGWGHTQNVCEGQVITQAQADNLFNVDVQKYEVPERYGSFNQNQFDALTSFAYNCGMGALDDVLTSGDITGTMAQYKKGGGIVLQGLVRRRAEEIALYNTPIYTGPTEYKIKEYPEKGIFTCTVEAINFRNKPVIASTNPIQGQYFMDENVSYDYVYITNLYTYISWVSHSGVRRYMPITDRTTSEKWGYCE